MLCKLYAVAAAAQWAPPDRLNKLAVDNRDIGVFWFAMPVNAAGAGNISYTPTDCFLRLGHEFPPLF